MKSQGKHQVHTRPVVMLAQRSTCQQGTAISLILAQSGGCISCIGLEWAPSTAPKFGVLSAHRGVPGGSSVVPMFDGGWEKGTTLGTQMWRQTVSQSLAPGMVQECIAEATVSISCRCEHCLLWLHKQPEQERKSSPFKCK